MDIQHVPGKQNVADYLSRIPGMETLKSNHIASNDYTLNLHHIYDTIPTNNVQT